MSTCEKLMLSLTDNTINITILMTINLTLYYSTRETGTHLKIVLVLAKLRMAPRTMPIPRSSEAFNCKSIVTVLMRTTLHCTGHSFKLK